MHTAPHNTVKVKEIQLKADRLAAGHSQESFAATCGSVSLATVSRAEQSHRIMQPSLKKMSDVLCQPVERYVEPSNPNESVLARDSIFLGSWLCLHAEQNRFGAFNVLELEVNIRVEAGEIYGDSRITEMGNTTVENYEAVRISGELFLAFFSVSDVEGEAGSGATVVKSTRGGRWLEGYTSWFDPNLDEVANSRIIFLKKESCKFPKLLEEARARMAEEAQVLNFRILLKTGLGSKFAISALNDR